MSQNQIPNSGIQHDAGGEEKRRRSRRTRKDCDQRTYVCKICEKTYLSNAALYTHVKNKHEGGQKAIKQEKEKPKPLENKNSSEFPFIIPEQLPIVQSSRQHKQFRYQSVDEQTIALENLRNFMKKYFPERNRGCSIKLICEDLAPENYQYIQPILRQACEIKYSEQKKSNLSINQVFGAFLMLMNAKVSSACINFLLRLFFYLHLALKAQSRREDICQKQNARELPNYFNSIILNRRIPSPSFDEDEMMHNPIIVCHVLEYFGNWLYDERFTDFKIVETKYQKNV